MEGCRIQGVPDHEVFLGTPSEIWRILGNSVNRNVSLALGLSLRDAWLANDPGVHRTPISAKATTLQAPAKSGNISMVSKPRTISKSRTVRRLTGYGEFARSPALAPPPSGDSSDDESGLIEWTYNYMMSLDSMSYAQSDQIQDTTRNSTDITRNSEKDKVSLKRPHVAFQETSMSQKEKSSKLARASSSSLPTCQTTRNAIRDEFSPQGSGNVPTLATTLKKVARDSLWQINLGYIPDEDESDEGRADSGEDSELEIISASVTPKSTSRRPRKRFGGRWGKISSSIRQIPVVINLLSDDEDEDIVSQHKRPVPGICNKTSRRNKSYAPTSASLGNHRGDGVGTSIQRHHLPISRPSYPQGPHHTQHASPPHITERPQRPYSYPNNTSYLSGHCNRPQPTNISALQNHAAEHAEQRDALGATLRKEVEMRERANREAKKRDAEGRGGETRQREIDIPVPLQKYVPVDNGDFMAYFQTNRYMGTKSGRAR